MAFYLQQKGKDIKLSNTTIKELSTKYRNILKKCAFLNAIILGVAFSTGAQATEIDIVITKYQGAELDTYSDPDNEYAAVVNKAIGSEFNSIRIV